jgi:hypothetical protein
MVELLEGVLKEKWSSISSGKIPKRIEFLYKSGFRKDILIAFSKRSPDPIAIGYLSNQDKIIERLDNHYSALSKISSLDGVCLKDFVPRPLIWQKVGGYQVLFVSPVKGKTISTKLRKKQLGLQGFSEFLRTGADWLLKLHNVPMNKTKTLDEILREGKLDPGAYGLAEKDLLLNIPVILMHGDFQPTNILYAGEKKFNVIDWEYSREGFPLYDLYYFLSHAFKQYRETSAKFGSLSKTIHQQRDNFNVPDEDDLEALFFEKSKDSALAGDIVRSFCTSTGVDMKLATILLHLFLNNFR